MAEVGEVVWMRCQAHAAERFASNEEAERRRCMGNQATFMGVSEWTAQTLPDLLPGAPRMPEGQGYVYQCKSCKKSYYVLMGAKF